MARTKAYRNDKKNRSKHLIVKDMPPPDLRIIEPGPVIIPGFFLKILFVQRTYIILNYRFLLRKIVLTKLNLYSGIENVYSKLSRFTILMQVQNIGYLIFQIVLSFNFEGNLVLLIILHISF